MTKEDRLQKALKNFDYYELAKLTMEQDDNGIQV